MVTLRHEVLNNLGKELDHINSNRGLFWHSFRGFFSKQFLAGLFWAVACGYINSVSQVYVDGMHWARFKPGEYQPLPDIGFVLLPKLTITRLPDIWNLLIVLGTMIPVLLFHPHKVKIIRRYAAIQGTCFLLRSMTIMATILPNPYTECVKSGDDDASPWIEAFKIMIGTRITCGDVLYSGHAANFTLMALIWQEYGKTFTDYPSAGRSSVATIKDIEAAVETGPPSGRLVLQEMGRPVHIQLEELHVGFPDKELPVTHHDSVSAVDSARYVPLGQSTPHPPSAMDWYWSKLCPAIFWIVASIGYLVIIACRFHYTVDVLVGIVVVAKQWGLYHMIIRTPALLCRVKFLQWYEQKGIYHTSYFAGGRPRRESVDQIFDIQDGESEYGFEMTPREGSVVSDKHHGSGSHGGLLEGSP